MRLSGIKLAGFKTFVDPTHLQLPSNLTGVVGPNGCGKSNLIDAVRWVLGETSIKNLRASDTEDVIFNGSRTRKPAGRAGVELLFDNSDGQITGNYAAYSEIAVKRELTRDGHSQYYLNGRKCLKRDVTDLFLGTGLGGKSQYAIIEQGMVSRMVEARPEELRQWLEEAAGISKYKERRRETESRIRQTRENLARLQDLQNELQARLEVLAKQASNAEKYKEFKKQERQLQAELLLLKAAELSAQSARHEQDIASLQDAADGARARIGAAEQHAEGSEQAWQQAQAQLNAEQAQVYECEARLAHDEQALAHARELQRLQVREFEQQRGRLQDIERRLAQERERADTAEHGLAAAEEALQAAQRQAEQDQQAASETEQLLQSAQQHWEQVSSAAQAPLLAVEGERVRQQQLDRALRSGEERLGRLRQEQTGLQTAPIQASLFDADTELAALAAEMQTLQQQLQACDQRLAATREARAVHDKQLHEARQGLSALRARVASLETLQQAALREDDAEFRRWLEQHGLRGHARLAERLPVREGWEAAAEHVLEAFLQAVVLPEAQALDAAPEQGPRSGAALLLADGVETARDGALESASAATLAQFVAAPAALQAMLTQVHTAADAAAAAQRLRTLPAGASVVTPDGCWRGHGWLRYPQRESEQSGVIARGAQLRELREQVQHGAAAVTVAEAALNELQMQIRNDETARREAAARLEPLRSRQAQRLAFRQSQAVRLEQVEQRARSVHQELQQLQAQQTQQDSERAEALARLSALEIEAEQARQQRAESQQALTQARERGQSARALAQRAVQAAHQAQVRQAQSAASVSALARSLAELQAQVAAAGEQTEALRQRALASEEPLPDCEAAVHQARAALEGVRQRLRSARLQLDASESARNEALSQRRLREAEKDAAVERLQKARLEFENLRTRREAADAQFADTGFARETLAAELPADAQVSVWEERLAQLGRRIDRLGAINLAAIEELEESRSRESFLHAQRGDVEQALATLEDAMRKLDRETQDRFRETFDRVHAIFRDRFPKIFGGGEAYLELTGEDLLDAGVRVMARPPGKRNSTIQLLSGGEKAMTAVALLLAFFELNPAPFCLMDEVDAPLDDANVGRYVEVLREMSQRVQFIIITHNKITMELASQLHGVTMQEPGVSRLVSVDVEQALAFAVPSRQTVEAQS